MAATCPEQDSSRDGRKHPLRGETKEIELDRSRSKKGSNSLTVLWHSGGMLEKTYPRENVLRRRLRGEGRGADQKQHYGRWWM